MKIKEPAEWRFGRRFSGALAASTAISGHLDTSLPGKAPVQASWRVFKALSGVNPTTKPAF